jgi:hypothetical protein
LGEGAFWKVKQELNLLKNFACAGEEVAAKSDKSIVSPTHSRRGCNDEPMTNFSFVGSIAK